MRAAAWCIAAVLGLHGVAPSSGGSAGGSAASSREPLGFRGKDTGADGVPAMASRRKDRLSNKDADDTRDRFPRVVLGSQFWYADLSLIFWLPEWLLLQLVRWALMRFERKGQCTVDRDASLLE